MVEYLMLNMERYSYCSSSVNEIEKQKKQVLLC